MSVGRNGISLLRALSGTFIFIVAADPSIMCLVGR